MLSAVACSGAQGQMLAEDKWQGKKQAGKESSGLQVL